MDLVERYLNAVAAQLPRDVREDIVAELRDEIMGRIEALEERLGRTATDDEIETLLREVGHPLTVAARYRPGPQSLIGPELYPWWMFGVKVALVVMTCVTLIGLAARVLIGDVYLGQAIGQALASLFSGAITVIGILTAAGFVLERQEEKPEFIAKWRVKDLGVFELGGDFDAETWGRKLARGDWSRPSGTVRPTGRMSPAAGAAASAIAWGVLLLWWTGLMPVAPIRPSDLGAVIDGVDYGRIVGEIAALAYWPVIGFAVARILFDLTRAASGGNVRLTALGDMVFGAGTAWGALWLWFWSPLSPVIWVATPDEFIERVRGLFDRTAGDVGGLATILMIIVVWSFFAELFRIARGAWRLMAGH